MSKITDLKPLPLPQLQTEFAGKVVDRVYIFGGNAFAIRFTDGSVLDIYTDDRFSQMNSAVDEAIGKYSCNFGCAGRMKDAIDTLAQAVPQIRTMKGRQEVAS